MAKDINQFQFDDATLTKLELFEQYMTNWVPVFIHGGRTHSMAIWDFFAGSGYDSDGKPGSPIRILSKIAEYEAQIKGKNAHVKVHLNEGKPRKAGELASSVGQYCATWGLGAHAQVFCHNTDFKSLFMSRLNELRQQPNLVFIDQYGLKEMSNDIFDALVAMPKTDFMFFLSSSYARRFSTVKEIQALYPTALLDELGQSDYSNVHRLMCRYYQQRVPQGNETRLYPFSLKKGANIYGVIFGSAHPLGVEKFLTLAWSQNGINGEANFDIDEDVPKRQRSLFPQMQRLTKLEAFERDLANMVLEAGEVTNKQVFQFALEHGHLGRHARECITKLKRTGKIAYEGQPGFSYNNCMKENKIVRIKAVGHGRQ